MKKAGVLFVFILVLILININLIPAEKSIDFNYPRSVNVDEEFNVEISLIDFDEDVYDVKIDILNNGKRISEIWDGNSWKSTFKYVNSVIDINNSNKGSFKLRVTKGCNCNAKIEVKIRDSKNHADNFLNYSIDIINGFQDDNLNPIENNTNSSNKNNNEVPKVNKSEISLEIKWNEDDMINEDEFEIEAKAFNLENKNYDIKVWIEFEDNDSVISDRYDEKNNEWKSGRYYVENFFEGSGNKTRDIKLRIRGDYKNFEGDARIFLKLKDSWKIVSEIDRKIEILEKQEKEDSYGTDESDEEKEIFVKAKKNEENLTTLELTGNVIYLGKPKLERERIELDNKKEVIYESKDELIKKYSIYGFSLLLILFCVLLIIGRLK